MSRRRSMILRVIPCAVALLAALGGCGSDAQTSLVGSYAVDVEATVDAAAGAGPKPTETQREHIRLLLGTEILDGKVSLDLGSDGRYRLHTGTGTGGSTVEGRWERTDAGVRAMPERVDGEALPLDARQGDEYRLEDGLLVLPWPNGKLYFRRR